MQHADNSDLVLLADVTAAAKGRRVRGHLEAAELHCRSGPGALGRLALASRTQTPTGSDLHSTPHFKALFNFFVFVSYDNGKVATCIDYRTSVRVNELLLYVECWQEGHLKQANVELNTQVTNKSATS